MRKLIFLFFMLAVCVQGSMAQLTPKWVEKAKRAVFSVVTYDENNKMLNTGNGFFVSEDGLAVSDYSLFSGAARADIVTAEGKTMPVSYILGANDVYDVVKFRVAIEGKKVPALSVATSAPAVGAPVWMLPYSTQKSIACDKGSVKEVVNIEGGYHYYTLTLPMKDKMVSCPVMNEAGEVFGLAQKSTESDSAEVCYAISTAFALSQQITALSFSDRALQGIGIRKGLPDGEDQALVYLLMASTQASPDEYGMLLDEFVKRYPKSVEGYNRRATYYLNRVKEDAAYLEKASKDLEEALNVSETKEDAYFNKAKLIYNYQLSGPENAPENWSYDAALASVREAFRINPLPIYTQLEGDILFAKQDYAGALTCYEKVNASDLASPASFFSAAKTKERLNATPQEILVMLDSCMAHCPTPLTADYAPYALERAQVCMNAGEERKALADYDAYFNAVNGQVNDVFYYYREQAALKSHQYQRALDDILKAIEQNPKELLYKLEYAVINIRVGRNEEAAKILNEVLKDNPNSGEAYRLLGLCYVQLKKQGEACTYFKKAKELGDPNVDSLIEKYCQ